MLQICFDFGFIGIIKMIKCKTKLEEAGLLAFFHFGGQNAYLEVSEDLPEVMNLSERVSFTFCGLG